MYTLFCRYNGILGDYPTNSHDIAPQILQKFLDHQKASRMQLPEICSMAIKDIIKPNNSTNLRGTLQAIGHDVEKHSALALTSPNAEVSALFQECAINGLQDIEFFGMQKVSFLTTEHHQMILQMHQKLFCRPDIHVDKHVCSYQSANYLGEFFRPDHGNTVNCNIVRAKWLKAGYELDIDTSEKLARAGQIVELLKISHKIDGRKGELLLVRVDWYSMHDDPSCFGPTMQVYNKPFCPTGPYSFMPVQRIISKCAHQICAYNNVNVRVVIPLAGKWAL